MIEIALDKRDGYCLHSKGHAGTAPRGKDIVCAAVSVLMYTAAQLLLEEQDAGTEGISVKIGYGEMCLTAKELPKNTLLRLEGVETGLALVEARYPTQVKMEEE